MGCKGTNCKCGELRQALAAAIDYIDAIPGHDFFKISMFGRGWIDGLLEKDSKPCGGCGRVTLCPGEECEFCQYIYMHEHSVSVPGTPKEETPPGRIGILTPDHLQALEDVRDGADVYSRLVAERLRILEKEGYVQIVDPMADIPGNQQQPFFGAIATQKGKDLLDTLEKTARAAMKAMNFGFVYSGQEPPFKLDEINNWSEDK